MKSANFPSLRVEPELREAAEACLEDGESLSSFIEHSVRETIARRQSQRQFIERGLASRDEARLSDRFVSAERVIDRLEQMLEAAKRRK